MRHTSLIQLDILKTIAYGLQIFGKVLPGNNHRPPAVVGMKGQCGGIAQVIVKKEMHMMLYVIDESKWRHTTWLQAKILHHSLGRCKGQLATRWQTLRNERSLQAMFKVMDVKVVVAMEAYQIMAVTLVIAKEKVFAVDTAIITPPPLGLLYGFTLRMIITFV